jgi:Uma2 family endonuclease
MIEGLPTLAGAILCPSDPHEEIAQTTTCLRLGVPLVWLVDPAFRTGMVHRPDEPPDLFNTTQTLAAEPTLPGLFVPVAELFAT